MRRLSIFVLCLTCYGLALGAGCGGGGEPKPDGGTEPPPTPDAGPPDAGPTPDAGPVDLVRPIVTLTIPENNALGVDPGSSISVTFSEPMRVNRGLVQISPGNLLLNARPELWDAANRTVTFTLAQGLPTKTKLTVNVIDFADVAGNPIANSYSFSFSVGDGQPPHVIQSVPAEGASELPVTTAEVSFTFSEPMDTSVGALRPDGGLVVGTSTWTPDKQTLKAPISGLAYDAGYAIQLQGFRNPRGTGLDPVSYLGNGQLDFTTGPDRTPPTVTQASPAEGAQNVPTDSTSFVVITFSEPMSATGTATLVDGTTRTALSATWSTDGFSLSCNVVDKLRPSASLRVELAGFKDRVGNALDLITYLGSNGTLDFATAADRSKPYVVSSDPVEGAQSVYPYETYLKTTSPAAVSQRKIITLQFSEPMDTSVTQSTLTTPDDSSVPPRTLTGTWSTDRRTLTFNIPPTSSGGPPLVQLHKYSLDLTNHKDPSGNLLDTTLPPLHGGKLTFDTIGNDSFLNLACEDMLLKATRPITATSNLSGSPVMDTLRERYAVTLLPNNGQYQGVVRFLPSTYALYSMFLSKGVPAVLTDPSTGSFVTNTQGATPEACPNNITYRVDFERPGTTDIRMDFGPSSAQAFEIVTHGTL